MVPMIITIDDELLKEIRREAFTSGVTVETLINLLVKLGLDIFTGRMTVEVKDDELKGDK